VPCIVFTEDLARNEFAWMHTGPDNLARQLLALGAVSADLAPLVHAQRGMPPRGRRFAPAVLDLQAVASDASGGAVCGVGDPTKRLADACLDIIAVGAMNGAGFLEREPREQRGRQAVAKLEAEVAKLRRGASGDQEELAEKVYELAVLRSLALAPTVEGGRRLQWGMDPPGVSYFVAPRPSVLGEAAGLMLGFLGRALDKIDAATAQSAALQPWQTWQSDARAAVVTADKLLMAFANDPDFDWSTVTVSTGKALEIEANYSVIQLVRQHLGAQMPRYYHKLAPDVALRVTSGEFAIDLNDKRGGTWAPITLGVVAHLLRHELTSEASASVAPSCPDPGPRLGALSNVAFALMHLRNEGAHQHTLPLAKAQQARAELDKLALNGGAEFLCACKAATAPVGS
jgi:hypothetical protein